MGTRGSSLGVKRPGREADHSPPPSAEVKEYVELYIRSPSTPKWRDAQLKKHRDYFTFTLLRGGKLNFMVQPYGWNDREYSFYQTIVSG
jgi:hypothetical protein